MGDVAQLLAQCRALRERSEAFGLALKEKDLHMEKITQAVNSLDEETTLQGALVFAYGVKIQALEHDLEKNRVSLQEIRSRLGRFQADLNNKS